MTFIVILGVVILLAVLVVIFTPATMPSWLVKIVLIAAALYLLLCVLQHAGCEPPFLPRPVPMEAK